MAGNMGQNHRYTVDVAGKEFIIETGRLAEQAGGAVTVTVGETVVFCAATMSKNAREGIDFFPLSVDFEEKLYAAGRIPGSFFRREGRPSEQAILTSRIIDRPLRPLFPDGMRNEVQIILTTFAHDQEHQNDMAGIIAASTALMISNIPWNGPVAGVRIGLINGELVVNPTIQQMEEIQIEVSPEPCARDQAGWERRRGTGLTRGSLPPRRASRRALSRSIRALRPSRISAVRSVRPVMRCASSSRAWSRLMVVRMGDTSCR